VRAGLGQRGDGICLDAEGNVWTPVPPNAAVLVHASGEVPRRIELDRNRFACALGADDGRTLFMMAAEWRGTEHLNDGSRTGRVVTAGVGH
jgi:sugar lactone lactonase YvrE